MIMYSVATCAVRTYSLYHSQSSNISRTKFQNLDVSRLVLQLSLLNSLKPGVMKMSALLQLHLSDQQCYYLLKCDLY